LEQPSIDDEAAIMKYKTIKPRIIKREKHILWIVWFFPLYDFEVIYKRNSIKIIGREKNHKRKKVATPI